MATAAGADLTLFFDAASAERLAYHRLTTTTELLSPSKLLAVPALG